MKEIGTQIFNLAKEIFPINRSITGPGVRETLKILKKYQPYLYIKSIPSQKKVFDWTVPNEWIINNGWIKDLKNKIIVDFRKNNLHVVGYSVPVNKNIQLKDLKQRIYTLKNQPNAIPYVTSYYKKFWGFCMEYRKYKKLKDKFYKVFIDSKFKKGFLNYGEAFFPGKKKKEILFSTYVCHPSMANNEVSGPSLSVFISRYVKQLKSRNYSYRFIFIPETIGAIAYINKNLKKLKNNVYAGFNLSCMGDNRNYSYIPSRNGNTIADKVATHILYWTNKNYKKYSWLDRGSDERQFCSPGVNLPLCTLMRTKFGEYKEYHTSLDKLGTVVKADGFKGSYQVTIRIIEAIENNFFYTSIHKCEPQMSKRNLYPNISQAGNINKEIALLMNILSLCDGKNSLLDIADFLNVPIWKLYNPIDILKLNKLIKK